MSTIPSGVNMKDQILKKTGVELPAEKLRILDICQHIFKQAESFYQHLIELHQDQGEIARTWGLLAVDKCNHSDTYKMATRLRGQGIRDICASPDEASMLLSKMKTIPKMINDKQPSVTEALRFVISMEEKLNSVHFRHVVSFFSDSDMQLMSSSLKSSSAIVHELTEEYINLTMFA
jgi:rubrerythrin